MKKLLSISALLVLFAGQAHAAGQRPSDMNPSSAIVGTQITWCPTPAGPTDFKCTFTQIDTFINSQFSGDATVAAGGAVTVTKTNGVAFAPSATTDATNANNLASGSVPAARMPALTGDVTSTAGSVATTVGNAAVIGKVLTGFTSGAGTVSAADTILAALQKINGNDALKLPLTGGTISGALTLGSTLNANALATTGTIAGSLCRDSSGNVIFNSAANCFVGGGSAGGSANQIQWNSAGSLAGFTFSGDMTVVPSTGVATLKNTGPGATGPIGSATVAPIITIDAQGRATALGSATIAPPESAVTFTAITTNNVSTTKHGYAPVLPNDATKYLDGTGAYSVPAGGGSGVTSVAAGCGTSTGGSPITSTGTVAAALGARINAATSGVGADFVAGDCGGVVYDNSASAVAAVLPVATTTGFGNGSFFERCNINAGVTTITPATSTIGGQATLVIQPGTAAHPNCTSFRSDGTNYSLIDTVAGAGVTAAMGNALSAAGGLTSTIARGTATLGTSAIASNSCATVVTVTAANVLTTDVASFGYNGDPTAITGYGASATGAILSIYPYPTAGNVNVKVCNWTGASITPGSALTVNWQVDR